LPRRVLGPSECHTRRFGSYAAHRDPGDYEFVGSPQGWREGRRVKISKHVLRPIQVSD
jgi:hypothetical protein